MGVDLKVVLLVGVVPVLVLCIVAKCVRIWRSKRFMQEYDIPQDVRHPDAIESRSMGRLPARVSLKQPVFRRPTQLAPGIRMAHAKWRPNPNPTQSAIQAIRGATVRCADGGCNGFSTATVDGDGFSIKDVAVPVVKDVDNPGQLKYRRGGIPSWGDCRPSRFPGQFATDDNLVQLGTAIGAAASFRRAGKEDAAKDQLAVAAMRYNNTHGDRFLDALATAKAHTSDDDDNDASSVNSLEETLKAEARRFSAVIDPAVAQAATEAASKGMRRVPSAVQNRWSGADDNAYQERRAREMRRVASKSGVWKAPGPSNLRRVAAALSPRRSPASRGYTSPASLHTEAMEDDGNADGDTGGGVFIPGGGAAPPDWSDSDNEGAKETLDAGLDHFELSDAPLAYRPHSGHAFNVVFDGAKRLAPGQHYKFNIALAMPWNPDVIGTYIQFNTGMALYSADIDTALLLGMLYYMYGNAPVTTRRARLLRRWGNSAISPRDEPREEANRGVVRLKTPYMVYTSRLAGEAAVPMPLLDEGVKPMDRIDARADFLRVYREMNTLSTQPVYIPAYLLVAALHTGAAILYPNVFKEFVLDIEVDGARIRDKPGIRVRKTTARHLHPVESEVLRTGVVMLPAAPEVDAILQQHKLFSQAMVPTARPGDSVKLLTGVGSPVRTIFTSTSAGTSAYTAGSASTFAARQPPPPGAVPEEELRGAHRV